MAIFEFTTAQPNGTVFSPTGLYFNTNTSTTDASGNGKDLTVSVPATVASSSEGHYSGIRGFCGGKYFRSDKDFRTLGSLSISCMMKITGSRPQNSYICSYGGPSGDVDGSENILYTYYFNDENKMATLHEYDSGTNETYTSAFSFPLNLWFHFGLTRDSTGKIEKIYLNGSLVDTLTYTNAPSGGSNASSIFVVGSSVGIVADTYQQMSSFAIYINKELTPSQVTYLSKRCLGR